MNHVNMIGKVSVPPQRSTDTNGKDYADCQIQLTTVISTDQGTVTKSVLVPTKIVGKFLRVIESMTPGSDIAIEGSLEKDADDKLYVLVNDLILL
jgi:single-stranded DNA-binding protein